MNKASTFRLRWYKAYMRMIPIPISGEKNISNIVSNDLGENKPTTNDYLYNDDQVYVKRFQVTTAGQKMIRLMATFECQRWMNTNIWEAAHQYFSHRFRFWETGWSPQFCLNWRLSKRTPSLPEYGRRAPDNDSDRITPNPNWAGEQPNTFPLRRQMWGNSRTGGWLPV